MMTVRLLEMRRVLTPTGSIYLHCDPVASHYLKLLMDAIFGLRNFRNEIVWAYQRWTGATKHFQRMHDILLMYARSGKARFNQLFEPHSEKGRHRHKGRNRVTKVAATLMAVCSKRMWLPRALKLCGMFGNCPT